MAAPFKFFGAFLGGALLALGIFLFLFYQQLGAPTESSRWAYEMNLKKRQAAEAIHGPKLLLVGGSSTLFGLSARQIQNATGYPTVNMASHAALGPAYIMQLTQKVAKPGDTVLLAFEYEAYDWGEGGRTKGWNDSLFFDYIFSRDPEYFRSMPWKYQVKTAMLISNDRLKQGLRNRRRAPSPKDGGLYDAKNINEFGDQTSHTTASRPAVGLAIVQSQKSDNLARGMSREPKGFACVRNFCLWAKLNKVRVLATFPSIAHHPEYDLPAGQKTPEALRAFFASLDVPVLGEARESILPVAQFWDTMYHLSEEGAQERTRRLLPHLLPYLQVHPSALISNYPPEKSEESR